MAAVFPIYARFPVRFAYTQVSTRSYYRRLEDREHDRVRNAQAAWVRRRANLWLFWAIVGLTLLVARVFVLPYFGVASSQWPGRTLMLALLLLVGGIIQWRLGRRRAQAIENGASSGEAFDAVQDDGLAVSLALAAEDVADVASEL